MSQKPPRKSPEKPASLASLAAALGYSTTSLRTWSRRPDAPRDRDVASWRTFVEANALGTVGNKVSKRRERALAVNVELRNELIRADLAERNKRTVNRADVDQMLLHTGSLQRAVLQAALEREYPAKVCGLTAAEIKVHGAALVDKLCTIFGQETTTWLDPNSP